MSPIDVTLVQSALRGVERALEDMAGGEPSILQVMSARMALISAKYELRAALVGNVEAKEEV